MGRYFFDVHDGRITHDVIGQELPNIGAVRKTAMKALPAIAADEIPQDGDKQSFVVVAKDECNRVVYTVTLSYVGLAIRAE